MSVKKNALLAAMGVVMALTAVTGASAETRFDRTHPARAEVNGRLVEQNHRIREERMAGKISVISGYKIRCGISMYTSMKAAVARPASRSGAA